MFGRLRWLLRPRDAYRVFTRNHDEVIAAGDLLDSVMEGETRGRYDAAMIQFLEDPSRTGLAAALADIPAPEGPAHVTILIDHSGSMRGANARKAALLTVELAGWLEAHGVAHDVLGYTTRGWHGGGARKDWIARGRPRRPGRLCDLRHIVYREDGGPENWRSHLGLLFAADVLREGVDGEALEWVEGRIARREPDTLEIVIQIGDGSPVDDSTQQANHPRVLEGHFLQVARRLNARPNVRHGLLTFREWPMDGVRQYPLGQAWADAAVAAVADLAARSDEA